MYYYKESATITLFHVYFDILDGKVTKNKNLIKTHRKAKINSLKCFYFAILVAATCRVLGYALLLNRFMALQET